MTWRHKPVNCQSEGRVAQRGMGQRDKLLKVETRQKVEEWLKERKI